MAAIQSSVVQLFSLYIFFRNIHNLYTSILYFLLVFNFVFKKYSILYSTSPDYFFFHFIQLSYFSALGSSKFFNQKKACLSSTKCLKICLYYFIHLRLKNLLKKLQSQNLAVFFNFVRFDGGGFRGQIF